MLLICDDFSRFTWTYFMRQKSDAFTLFEQFLADERVAGIPSPVEVIRFDEGGEFIVDFAKLCRRHNIRQEFPTADSAKFNGVAERHIAMIESAGMAAQVQAKSLFRGFKITPSDSGLYRQSIPVRQSCMTDTDSHSWSSSVASASSTNNATESKSNCFCSPRVSPCRTTGVSPSHLSS